MKKNKMMRLASVLLVAVLLSTCAISGTFAKYVTTATAEDTARVAKWGIEIATWDTDDINGDTSVFEEEYDNTVAAGGTTDLLVVAPGTANLANNKITFSVKGTAEVDLKLDFVMNVVNDVYVKQGTYLDWTTGNNTTDTFEVENTTTGKIGDADITGYFPVVFTLTKTKTSGAASTTVVATGNLTAIQTAFNALSQTTVEANTALDEEWTLTWAWDFDAEGAGTNDKADTLLGNNAAGIATDTGVSTRLTYNIEIKATQIN